MRHRRLQSIFGLGLLAVLLANPVSVLAQRSQTGTTTAGSPLERRAQGELLGQRITAYLNDLKTQFERARGLSESDKRSFIKAIAGDISRLQTETFRLNKAEDAATIQQRVDAMRENWLNMNRRVKYYVGLILTTQVRFAIDRFVSMQTKIETLFNRLSAADERREAIALLKDEFTQQLTSAQGNLAKAQELLAQIEQSEDPQATFKSLHDALKQAHRGLRDARQTFRSILQALKQALPQRTDPLPTTTDEQQT